VEDNVGNVEEGIYDLDITTVADDCCIDVLETVSENCVGIDDEDNTWYEAEVDTCLTDTCEYVVELGDGEDCKLCD